MYICVCMQCKHYIHAFGDYMVMIEIHGFES